MKSDKLKKLLKKIKKLKKLKKAKKVKKSKAQNLNLNADIETLKQKLKQQEIQLSQMKYPQPAPVSTVSYERMGIGQQNALNQANLESIQKNIEDKLEDQAKLIDIPNAISNIKQRGLRPQKEGESDKDYDKYVKKAISNKKNYADRKLKKSIEITNNSSGVKSKINTQGTLKKPVYSDTDNQGEFPASEFNSSSVIPDPNQTIDTDVEKITNEIQSSLNQIDSKEDFVDTTTDQSISIKNKKSPSTPKVVIKIDKPLSKAQIRKLKKEEFTKIKQQTAPENELNIPQKVIDITLALEKQNQQIKQQELNVLNSFTEN